MNLSDIKPRHYGIVTGFAKSSQIRRHLQDLGVIRGTKIECISRSPLGDPSAYLIRKTIIALRREDAEQIYISEVDQ